MLPKRWSIKPVAPSDLLARYGNDGINPVLAQVLYNRNFTTPEEAARFLNDHRDRTSSVRQPLLTGIESARDRIRDAVKQDETIAVYGDFDADGVTSTVLLVEALKAFGAKHVIPYIPHRVDEGYGVNSDALLKLKREDGVTLVITVDCGIRSVQEVEDGKAMGLDIIITDHHSLGPELPDALAVINPKQDDATLHEPMLAGVGVAYKLAEALLSIAGKLPLTDKSYLDVLDDLTDLVAIGTVADLAPLNRAENRWLVRRGLERLNKANRPGVRALLAAAGARPGSITASSIGYTIGPRINAAGRLDSAMLAYNLLSAANPLDAERLATELQALNAQRQELTRTAQQAVKAFLQAQGEIDAPLIFASDTSFLPGIVGLVAGRLVEEFYRPAVVMEQGECESRASCRSIPQFDITAALDECADLLVRHGGHAQAAGFTIANRNIPAFRDRLMGIAERALDGQALQPTLEIDAVIGAPELSMDLCAELARLEPLGHHNNTPVFMTPRLRVLDYRTVGKGDDHLKLKLTAPGLGVAPFDAIGFHLGALARDLPGCVDVAFELEINEFNGNRTLQLNVQDVRAAGGG